MKNNLLLASLLLIAASGQKNSCAAAPAPGPNSLPYARFQQKNGVGFTPLQCAIINGNTEAAERLIALGARANEISTTLFFSPRSDSTTLMLAAEYSSAAIVQLLLDHCAATNINYQSNETGETALMRAVQQDKIETVQILLHSGANPNLSNFCKATALNLAQEIGNQAMIDLLSPRRRCTIS